MFEWILELEQEGVKCLSSKSLTRHQEELVENVLVCIDENIQLLDKWKALFSVSDSLQVPWDVDPLMLQFFKETVTCYVKMGVGEFLRDFRRLQTSENWSTSKESGGKEGEDLVSKVTLGHTLSDIVIRGLRMCTGTIKPLQETVRNGNHF